MHAVIHNLQRGIHDTLDCKHKMFQGKHVRLSGKLPSLPEKLPIFLKKLPSLRRNFLALRQTCQPEREHRLILHLCNMLFVPFVGKLRYRSHPVRRHTCRTNRGNCFCSSSRYSLCRWTATRKRPSSRMGLPSCIRFLTAQTCTRRA